MVGITKSTAAMWGCETCAIEYENVEKYVGYAEWIVKLTSDKTLWMTAMNIVRIKVKRSCSYLKPSGIGFSSKRAYVERYLVSLLQYLHALSHGWWPFFILLVYPGD